MMANSFEGLDMVAVNNAIARRHPDTIPTVESFPSADDAYATVNTALQETGERVIRLLRPDYVKRGKAATRFPLYKDGMLANDFVEACVAGGHPVGEAKRDLRHDHRKGFIQIV